MPAGSSAALRLQSVSAAKVLAPGLWPNARNGNENLPFIFRVVGSKLWQFNESKVEAVKYPMQ